MEQVNQQNRTVEQVVEALALLEVPCPCICHLPNSGYSPPGYHGYSIGEPDEYGLIRPESPLCRWACTGQVAEFKMLRRPCEHDPDVDCNGRGWLPVTTVEALLKAVLSQGFCVFIVSHNEVRLVRKEEYQVPWPQVWFGFGESLEESLALALEAALQQEAK